MTTQHIIVVENTQKFDTQRIKHAFEGRYKTTVDVDSNDVMASIQVDDKTFKKFTKKFGKKFSSSAVETIVYEDFTDEFEQEFEDND